MTRFLIQVIALLFAVFLIILLIAGIQWASGLA